MSFSEAVSTVFSKYAVFGGRAGRSEFWWFVLFNLIASLILGVVDHVIFGREVLGAIYALGVILPALAVSVRRLHDIDRSGWWLLIGLVPVVGTLVLLFWYIKEATPGANRYGAPG
jgi:uncharacterized membrane protein YhaH (DUF805 family)